MSLNLISTFSPSPTNGESLIFSNPRKILNFRFLHRKQGSGGYHGLCSSLDLPFLTRKQSNGFWVSSEMDSNIRPIQGLDCFDPFEEVKTSEAFLVPSDPHQSLGRQSYADECEKAVNEQIKFFEKSSKEEREHALKLMRYQTMRGGKVKLYSIVSLQLEYDHVKKGDALYAMELVLSLEKLVNMKLHQLQTVIQLNPCCINCCIVFSIDNSVNAVVVAVKNYDVQLADYVDSEFLREQVESIKKISEYVAQLRRVGKGHGTWHFDQMLLKEGAAA
ncbi:hypothetical protein Sjap_001502 [Stephania japonica]|uniref:Ferritin/DPS domain-containing protein n=1 Tax=Stephania japonica TaxID=461633 RepID=A0AAP0KMD3_9MAGN